jgi:hypothetical protein
MNNIQDYLFNVVKQHMASYLHAFLKNSNMSNEELNELATSVYAQELLITELSKLSLELKTPDNKLIIPTASLKKSQAMQVVNEFVADYITSVKEE